MIGNNWKRTSKTVEHIIPDLLLCSAANGNVVNINVKSWIKVKVARSGQGQTQSDITFEFASKLTAIWLERRRTQPLLAILVTRESLVKLFITQKSSLTVLQAALDYMFVHLTAGVFRLHVNLANMVTFIRSNFACLDLC